VPDSTQAFYKSFHAPSGISLKQQPAAATRWAVCTCTFDRTSNAVMKPDDRERMYELCAKIEKEKDHARFLKLIEELNELLERQQHPLDDKPKD
jgi:hypothetical protein